MNVGSRAYGHQASVARVAQSSAEAATVLHTRKTSLKQSGPQYDLTSTCRCKRETASAQHDSMSDSNDSDVQIVRETSAADCQKCLRDDLKLVSRVATTLRLQVQDVALECQAAVEDRLAAQRGTALSQQQQSVVQSQWGVCEARPKDILTARHKVEVSGADFSTLQSDRWLKVQCAPCRGWCTTACRCFEAL